MAEKFGNKYRIPPARKPNWDYGRNATYFIIICILNREHFFGEIISGIDDGCANRTDVAVQTLHATSPSAPIVQTLPYRRCMQRLHPHQSYRRCRTDVACNVSIRTNRTDVAVQTLHATSLQSGKLPTTVGMKYPPIFHS